MPFLISINRIFHAAHQLRMYDGALEPLHEHDWRVRVEVSADKLDQIGVVMDFHELERLVDEVIAPMRDRSLNDVPAFSAQNPSAENVALHIGQSLQLPRHIKLHGVEVWETPECAAVWRP